MRTTLRTPLIVINFKTYEESTGKNGLKLAKICDAVARKTKTRIVIAVQEADIYHIAQEVSIPVFAQHVDPIGFGAHTGHVLATDLRQNGAEGSLINHSEDQMSIPDIKAAVEAARAAGLATIVCASTPALAGKVALCKPDMIAVEPPQLIGGEVSVSSANPKIISATVSRLVKSKIPLLCGAGVKDGEDVRISLKLGVKGVLVASHVVRAKDPKKVLLELVKGMQNSK